MPLSRAQAAALLLTCVLPAQDVETIIGDLTEECACGTWSSSARTRWYWAQLLRSIPAFLWLPIQRGGWKSTFGVALAACAAQAAIEVTTRFAMYQLPLPDAWWAPLSLVVTLPCLMFLGYRATRVRPGAATALPAVIAFGIVMQLLLAAWADAGIPLATQVASLVVAPSVALAGGVLSLKTQPH
jgi:hypothetical protein